MCRDIAIIRDKLQMAHVKGAQPIAKTIPASIKDRSHVKRKCTQKHQCNAYVQYYGLIGSSRSDLAVKFSITKGVAVRFSDNFGTFFEKLTVQTVLCVQKYQLWDIEDGNPIRMCFFKTTTKGEVFHRLRDLRCKDYRQMT